MPFLAQTQLRREDVCSESTSEENDSSCITQTQVDGSPTYTKEPLYSETSDASAPSSSESSSLSRKRKNSSVREASESIATETTRFTDIIGHAAVKVRCDELLLPLGLPSSVTDSILVGVRSLPASILLYGPPGCGKTKLARALAGEARAAFLPVAPSDVFSKYVGVRMEAFVSVAETQQGVPLTIAFFLHNIGIRDCHSQHIYRSIGACRSAVFSMCRRLL
jgi:ATP-dependent Zn protease